MKKLALTLTLLSTSAMATDLPTAIDCYQSATQSKNIDAYMACFADGVEMVDVSRTFTGKDALRQWALSEVIPYGERFTHLDILDSDNNTAKTLVQWMSWKAHYDYWWDDAGKITKMSLQYAD